MIAVYSNYRINCQALGLLGASYYTNAYEGEIIGLDGNKQPNAISTASSQTASYAATKFTDGDLSTIWQTSSLSAGAPVWVMISFPSAVQGASLRVYMGDAPSLLPARIHNATIYGSNDTTDGVDGTWDVLASGFSSENAINTWTSISLTAGPNSADKKHTSTPVILSTMPAALTRGFR